MMREDILVWLGDGWELLDWDDDAWIMNEQITKRDGDY
jgi:hypothetical protein